MKFQPSNPVFLVCVCVLFFLFSHAYADNDISISAKVGEDVNTGSSSTTGGGTGTISGGNVIAPTSIEFFGQAYPFAKIFVLENGIQVSEVIADSNGQFSLILSNITPGSYTFSIVAEDSMGNRSSLFTLPIFIAKSTTTTVKGIFLSPTITVSPHITIEGGIVTIYGEAAPDSMITITIGTKTIYTTQSDMNGKYQYLLNTRGLYPTIYRISAHAQISNTSQTSSESPIVLLTVTNSEVTIPSPVPVEEWRIGDFNHDHRVNIIDFSMLSYWYHKGNAPAIFDLNDDGVITIVDFSIFAYYWTG